MGCLLRGRECVGWVERSDTHQSTHSKTDQRFSQIQNQHRRGWPDGQSLFLASPRKSDHKEGASKNHEAGNARLAKKRSMRSARTRPLHCLSLPCVPPSSAGRPGAVRRICLSTWLRSGSCEFMRRPGRSSNAGNPRSGRRAVGDFFGLPFLARQER